MKFDWKLKVAPHSVHWCGLSPVWTWKQKNVHFENFWTINIPSHAPLDCLALETSFHRFHIQSHCVSSTCVAPASLSSWTYSGTGCIGNSSSRSPHACSHGTAWTGHGCKSSRTWGLWWFLIASGCASAPGTWAFGHTMSLLEMPEKCIIFILQLWQDGGSKELLGGDRVAKVGSLSARTKVAINMFVRRVFVISATNASFLHVICKFNSKQYAI